MANTIVTGGKQKNVVQITVMDSDYDSEYERPVDSIQFTPGSTGTDVLSVKADTDAGPEIMRVTADAADDETIKYFRNVKLRVVIDYSACTLSSGHKVIIIYGEDY